MNPIQILIADDHELFRRSLRSLVESRVDWRVCGEAGDGREAVAKAKELKPDVILLDVTMPEMNGLEAARLIRNDSPHAQILIISQNDASLMRKAAEEAGAKGFIEKSKLSQQLMKAVDELTPKAIVTGSNGNGHRAGGTKAGKSAEASLAWLNGGGEMGDLIRSMDWSTTPLGPLENWPQSLRTTISLSLSSNFPINIVWGSSYNQIYNDGYRVLVGERHPEGMGMPYDKCWASAWPAIGEPFERGWRGETSFLENQRMYLTRNGYLEETFFTFSLSPIRDENGVVVGLFHPVTETTVKMLSERRTRALRELAANTSEARSLEAAFALIGKTLAKHELDLPFVLLYSLSKDGKDAHLLESVGIDSGLSPTQAVIRIDSGEESGWPVDWIRESDDLVEIDDIRTRFGAFACGPYEEGASRAVAHVLRVPGQSSPLGFFIAGVSPRLPFNQDYRDYFEQVSGAITTTLSNALAYEQEKQRAEALAEIDRAKTLFFSNVSHEFRTPLTLMMGPLEDALSQSDGLSSSNRERLDVAHRNSQRLLKLVNTLLDFSRIEAGRIQASYEPVDLALVTAELAGVFRSTIERAGMRLVVDCPQLPEQVYVDREMWEKIILNLLSNAFKFTFEGEIAVSLRAVASDVELTVRDTGTGIPEEEISRLFERFHRVKNARGRSYEGSGIGLALVQELVKLHGGVVRVESRINQGSAFIVSIPFGKDHLPADRIRAERTMASTGLHGEVYVDEAARWLPDTDNLPSGLRSMPLSAAESAGTQPPSARILLADDNADMRKYVRKLLSKRYEVTAVADGESALASVREQPPDLILSDIMMPRLDGFGLLRAIRADETLKNVPVILLSARVEEESRLEGLGAGADDYLAKPFSARELLARVGSHLALAKIRQQASESEQKSRIDAELLAAIVSSSDDAIISKNLDGVITTWNKGAERIFGYTAEEAIGKSITLIIPPNRLDEEAEIISKLRRGERLEHFETVRMRKDGTNIDISVTISPIKDSSGRVTGASKVARDISALKQAERALREATETLEIEVQARTAELVQRNSDVLRQSELLRDLSRRLLQAQDEERRRIARELHDSAGQTLTVLGMTLAIVGQQAQQKKTAELSHTVGDAEQLVRQLHQEIRTMSYLLHPPLLDEAGLAAALTWYIEGLTARSGLKLSLMISDDFERLSREMELVVFRLVQECLTNIHRHSGSKTADIRIVRETGQITVEVRDQGKGISRERLAELQAGASGVGIRGMRERVRPFNGDIQIESNGSGTRVLVVIPLPKVSVQEMKKPSEPLQAAV
ncbi:MAG TPA: response regulator [Terriglobales bacterium]